MIGLRPPGFEIQILCLEDSVISLISPSSEGFPGPIQPVCTQKWPKPDSGVRVNQADREIGFVYKAYIRIICVCQVRKKLIAENVLICAHPTLFSILTSNFLCII